VPASAPARPRRRQQVRVKSLYQGTIFLYPGHPCWFYGRVTRKELLVRANRLAITSGLCLVFTLAGCSEQGGPTGTVRLSKQEYLDKCKGAWAGQMVGVCYGEPYQFQYNGQIVPSTMRPWNPEHHRGRHAPGRRLRRTHVPQGHRGSRPGHHPRAGGPGLRRTRPTRSGTPTSTAGSTSATASCRPCPAIRSTTVTLTTSTSDRSRPARHHLPRTAPRVQPPLRRVRPHHELRRRRVRRHVHRRHVHRGLLRAQRRPQGDPRRHGLHP
jgi:hypothetical protein